MAQSGAEREAGPGFRKSSIRATGLLFVGSYASAGSTVISGHSFFQRAVFTA